MKALLLTAALLAPACAFAVPLPAAIDQDPLMKQILAKQLTHPKGGVTAAVAVKGAANGIELKVTDPLAPLQPVAGLAAGPEAAEAAAAAPARKRKVRPSRRADEQAEQLEAAGLAASFDRAGK